MLAAAVVLALPATAAPKPLATLRANLTTEVPGPGDPNGYGHAVVKVYKFFLSSRRRHTRSLCDWSSDVCSSDLAGYNKGRSVPFNGPFHLRHVPWVAGDLGTTLGTATGAALALQDAGTDGVCVCAFGDGTANRGDFHENVNLAACWSLPIVYLCQHNGWAISEPAEMYLPGPIVDRAAGYGIPGVVVDGNDVEAVQAAVGEAVERARRGDGPTLIEART